MNLAPQDATTQALQLEWIVIYGDILQKFFLIAISSFLFAQHHKFQELFTQKRGGFQKSRIVFAAGLSLIGMASAGLGYIRYGETDWSFLDLQLVFTSATGIVLGAPIGLASGILASIFRTVIGAGRFQYWIILIAAGFVAGWLFDFLNTKKWPRRGIVLISAVTCSLIHGLVTYLPIASILGGAATFETVLSLTIIESLCIYMFTAVLFGVIDREERKKLEKLLPEMKLKFLQAQINPHFLFNTLNTIAAVCMREKADNACELVVKLSNYFRRILKRADEWVTLEEEIDYVNAYLDIEKARFQNALQVNYKLDLGKRGFKTMIPILIIQPLVENAIKHGISEKAGGGTLEICARENKKTVEIIIKDNGVGFPPALIKKLKSDNGKLVSEDSQNNDRIGLHNINERLRYQFGPDSELEIHSEAGTGTSVRFEIPIEHDRGD